MIANYLVSALRSFLRHKLIALINVIGLAVGLAACTLIILFVRHEFSYDAGFSDLDRLYRIESSPDLQGEWDELTDEVEGEAGPTSTYDFVEPQPLPGRRYYRVLAAQ